MTNEDRLSAREQRVAEEQAATARLALELAAAEERIRLEPTLVLGNRTMPQMIEAERQRKADEVLLEQAQAQWAELQAAEEAAKAAKQAVFQDLAERERRGRDAPVRRRKLLRFALAVTAAPVIAAVAYAGVLAGSSLAG